MARVAPNGGGSLSPGTGEGGAADATTSPALVDCGGGSAKTVDAI